MRWDSLRDGRESNVFLVFCLSIFYEYLTWSFTSVTHDLFVYRDHCNQASCLLLREKETILIGNLAVWYLHESCSIIYSFLNQSSVTLITRSSHFSWANKIFLWGARIILHMMIIVWELLFNVDGNNHIITLRSYRKPRRSAFRNEITTPALSRRLPSQLTNHNQTQN